MKCARFVSIPVFSVFLVLGFVYYITIFVFLEDWLGLQSSAGSLNALIFTYLACFSLFSFLVCVLTDPGGVPSAYVPDVEDSELSDQDSKKTGTRLSQCDKCSSYKPPRTHHCRSCRRCILRMDHHCMWINNCVGLRNYKAFIVLVLYATMASIYSSALTCLGCSSKLHSSEGLEFLWNGFPQDLLRSGKCRFLTIVSSLIPLLFWCSLITFISGVIIVGLSLTLGTLLGWHIYLILHNMTTIEYYEAIRAAWLARKSGQSYRHPYNVGIYKNITLVLGPNMLNWLCPTAVNHIKDGITFPTIRDSS
ncbi:probable protein S-acyltransferase 15 isoform X2 [Camellia sinensis]|uniref:probable protein S-acyltransferase 15 isoform X2 n=1 Tax=Camellia sinensis TaxID=4442 RepID=UPI001035ECF7|nr:probable protein S-acyltransferase 15 isoform X2 [Camellia sinensis]